MGAVAGPIHRVGKPPGGTAKASSTDKVLLTLAEAAALMGIGRQALRELVETGKVYAIDIGTTGRYRRVPVAEIEKWRAGTYDHGPSGAGQG